jgi:hypothetical protein
VPLNLCNYEKKTRDAIKLFWNAREFAKLKQKESGKSDQGERAGVTGGKNMDGFSDLVIELVRANGLPNAEVHKNRAVLTLPGYFRPTKLWDLLVRAMLGHHSAITSIIELKRQLERPMIYGQPIEKAHLANRSAPL